MAEAQQIGGFLPGDERGRRRGGRLPADSVRFPDRGSCVFTISFDCSLRSPVVRRSEKRLEYFNGPVVFPEIHQDDAEKVAGENLLRPVLHNDPQNPDRFREIVFIEGDLSQELMGCQMVRLDEYRFL